MVVALLALAVALSGSAYAVTSTINGNELKDRSVAGIKLEGHTLGAAQINKAALGLVPSAATARNARTLGGIAPTGFVQGPGHRAFARLVLAPAATSDHELFRLPGLVDVRGGCLNSTTPPTIDFSFTNLSGTSLDVVRSIMVQTGPEPISTDGFTLAPAGPGGRHRGHAGRRCDALRDGHRSRGQDRPGHDLGEQRQRDVSPERRGRLHGVGSARSGAASGPRPARHVARAVAAHSGQ